MSDSVLYTKCVKNGRIKWNELLTIIRLGHVL